MKLFEVFQKYDPYRCVVHWSLDGINYSYRGDDCVRFRIFINEEVDRIQKKGEYRHVYLRKEVNVYDS